MRICQLSNHFKIPSTLSNSGTSQPSVRYGFLNLDQFTSSFLPSDKTIENEPNITEAVSSARQVLLKKSTINAPVSASSSVLAKSCTLNKGASAGFDLTLDNTQFKGQLSAGKNIKAHQSNGTAQLQAGTSVILSNTIVIGSVQAGSSVVLTDTFIFDGGIQAGQHVQLNGSDVDKTIQSGHSVTLEHHSKAGSITISEVNPNQFSSTDKLSGNRQQTVTIQGQSSVEGDIVFLDKKHPGLVIVDSTAKIKGNVINGRIVKKLTPDDAKHIGINPIPTRA
jgi:NDP-sugar pyrophosphorylase family protein